MYNPHYTFAPRVLTTPLRTSPLHLRGKQGQVLRFRVKHVLKTLTLL